MFAFLSALKLGNFSGESCLAFVLIMASCRDESEKYRECLREKKSSGRKCDNLAKSLEECRVKWRAKNKITLDYDGTRVLPNPKCEPLSATVQHCLKWKGGDESKCKEAIDVLNMCMAEEKGVVGAPTAGDKIWSDFKKKNPA